MTLSKSCKLLAGRYLASNGSSRQFIRAALRAGATAPIPVPPTNLILFDSDPLKTLLRQLRVNQRVCLLNRVIGQLGKLVNSVADKTRK
jgi:hypothetical protein